MERPESRSEPRTEPRSEARPASRSASRPASRLSTGSSRKSVRSGLSLNRLPHSKSHACLIFNQKTLVSTPISPNLVKLPYADLRDLISLTTSNRTASFFLFYPVSTYSPFSYREEKEI